MTELETAITEAIDNEGDKWPPPLAGRNMVSRKEYDELFLAITRLTDRIEALESMVGVQDLGLYDLNRTEFPAVTPRGIIHAALVHQGRRK